MRFPSKFVDADLSVVPDGHLSGLIEQSNDDLLAAAADVPFFEERFPDLMVPRSEWKERAQRTAEKFRKTVAQIYSQGRTSACVGFSTAQAVETTATRQFGIEHRVPLSGMDVYSDIGRTLMSGAYIPDGITRVVKSGVLPLRTSETEDVYEHTFNGLDYSPRRRNREFEQTSKQFRVAEWAKAQGAEEIFSALLNGFCGVVGRSRHAIPYVYAEYDGKPYCTYANSWSKDWGDDGFGYDSERTFDDLVMYVILDIVVREEIVLPAL